MEGPDRRTSPWMPVYYARRPILPADTVPYIVKQALWEVGGGCPLSELFTLSFFLVGAYLAQVRGYS